MIITGGPPPRTLLVVSSGAGSLTAKVARQIDDAFPGVPRMEFDPDKDYRTLVAPRGTVVVAGGDGTIGFVARQLAGSDVTMGILSFGTFNNFARSLGLDSDPAKAIAAVLAGKPTAVTLGRVNGEVFLEAAAVGLFGQAIGLGEAAKDRTFGELGQRIRQVAGAKPFEFELSGDIEGWGRAMSLVFANTGSIGARLEVAHGSPVRPYLELSVLVGRSRTDVVGRVLAATLAKDDEPGEQQRMSFKFRSLRVETKPRMPIYADNKEVGRTPLVIEAQVEALRVLLPPSAIPRAARSLASTARKGAAENAAGKAGKAAGEAGDAARKTTRKTTRKSARKTKD